MIRIASLLLSLVTFSVTASAVTLPTIDQLGNVYNGYTKHFGDEALAFPKRLFQRFEARYPKDVAQLAVLGQPLLPREIPVSLQARSRDVLYDGNVQILPSVRFHYLQQVTAAKYRFDREGFVLGWRNMGHANLPRIVADPARADEVAFYQNYYFGLNWARFDILGQTYADLALTADFFPVAPKIERKGPALEKWLLAPPSRQTSFELHHPTDILDFLTPLAKPRDREKLVASYDRDTSFHLRLAGDSPDPIVIVPALPKWLRISRSESAVQWQSVTLELGTTKNRDNGGIFGATNGVEKLYTSAGPDYCAKAQTEELTRALEQDPQLLEALAPNLFANRPELLDRHDLLAKKFPVTARVVMQIQVDANAKPFEKLQGAVIERSGSFLAPRPVVYFTFDNTLKCHKLSSAEIRKALRGQLGI